MADFSNHNGVLTRLKDAQTVELENRAMAREAVRFVDDRDGQWEQEIATLFDGKPRYTFDQTSPIVENIAGEIDLASFDISISPGSGDASEDMAKIYDGMVRNIQSISKAKHIFNTAARAMTKGGLAGWKVEQAFVDGDSFNQDLVIRPVADFANRVWFDPSAKEQDKSDAKFAFDIVGISKEEYEERFPGRAGVSVQKSEFSSEFGFAPDDIFIGQLYWKEEKTRTLVEMTDGSVYDRDDEKFKSVIPELAEKDIKIKQENGKDRERKRKQTVVMFRLFDGSDWLGTKQKTVFANIPLVPIYGNYTIADNKTRYRGVVEKLMDTQRVFNYSTSREIEEGALAPRAKYWLTKKQAAGNEATLATMNTNSDPMQIYNHDKDSPGAPRQQGGAMINAGLRIISDSMRSLFQGISGLFPSNMGDNPNAISGVAIKRLQDKGDVGTVQFFTALEFGICYTGQLLVDAIPFVYDTERQQRLLSEDGSTEIKTLNKQVFDNKTKKFITLDDLSIGSFSVTCSAGPSFQNRQQEAVAGILETARVDPSIITTGKDILLRNMSYPGSKELAERARVALFRGGVIPLSQMDDEEKKETMAKLVKAQREGPKQDPLMVAAQAEMVKAQDDQAKTAVSVEAKRADIAIAVRKEDREDAKFVASTQTGQEKAGLAAAEFDHTIRKDAGTFGQNQQKLEADIASTEDDQRLAAQNQQFNQVMENQRLQMEQTAAVIDVVAKLSTALQSIQDAAKGPVVGPGFINNVREGSDLVTDAQQGADEVI